MALTLDQLSGNLQNAAAPVADSNPLAGAVQPAAASPAPGGANPLAGAEGMGADILANLPPQPAQGGISEDMATQFRRLAAQNTNALTNQNPGAVQQPGGWARAILGGVQSALGGLDIGQPMPAGSVGINGAQAAVASYRDRMQKAQERKDQLAQQARVNAREDRKEDREAAESTARINALTIADQRAASKFTQEQDDRRNAMGKTASESIEKVVAPIDKGVTEDMLQAGVQSGKYDMTKVTGYPVGTVMTQRGGKPTEETVYDILPSDNTRVPVTPEMAAVFKKQGYPDLTEGVTLPLHDLHWKYTQAMAAQTYDEQMTEAAKKAKIEANDVDLKLQSADDKAAVTPWLGAHPGDRFEALSALAQQKGKDGQLTPEAQSAARLMAAYPQAEIETHRHNLEEEQTNRIKANGQVAKNNPPEIEGDPSLHGPAYINSLPPGRAALVKMITNGQIGAVSPRLLAGKDGQLLMAEAAQADPDLDTTKISAYKDLLKGFTSGKEAQQIKALNTVLPHLDQMYNAIQSGFGTTTPGLSQAEQFFGNANAVQVAKLRTQAAQELAGVYATGAITDQEHKEFAKELNSVSPWDLRESLYTITTLLEPRIAAIEDQWQKGLPSPNWRPNRVVLDPKAQQAMSDIIAVHSGAKSAAENQIPATTAAATKTPTPQTHTFDVQAWKHAYPNKDVNAAIKAAQDQGYKILGNQ